MKKIGIVHNGKSHYVFENKCVIAGVDVNNVHISEVTEKFLETNDIIFLFDEPKLNSVNIYDLGNLNLMTDLWGYSFENDISVSGKIFVICTDMNVGETNRIHELLNPMNIEIVFCPIHNKIIDEKKKIIGTLNPIVFSDLSNLFSKIYDNLESFQMSYESAELLNLSLSQIKLAQNIHLKSIEKLFESVQKKQDYKIFEKFIVTKQEEETVEDLLRNSVLSTFYSHKKIFQNPASRNFDDKNQIQELILNNILNEHTNKVIPLVLRNICYCGTQVIDPSKYHLIKNLIKNDYKILILEDQNVISGNIPKELHNDFGDKVKFYLSNSQVDGVFLDV